MTAPDAGLPHAAYHIREVTVDSLPADLEAGRLLLAPEMRVGLEDAIGAAAVSFFVAETTKGEPCGQVGANWQAPMKRELRFGLPGAVNLGFLEVPKAVRGKGIGTALIHSVFDAARDRSRSRVFLLVNPTNEPARRLYGHLGFVDSAVGLVLSRFLEPDDHGAFQQVERWEQVMVADVPPAAEPRPEWLPLL